VLSVRVDRLQTDSGWATLVDRKSLEMVEGFIFKGLHCLPVLDISEA
jgi:hypothetical protein